MSVRPNTTRGGPRGRWRRRRRVRRLHALDEGAVARTDHADVQAGERCSRRSAAPRATCRRSRPRRPARASTAARSRCPTALGNKIIHPYSDFLLHDIGTGDGIPVLPTPEFAATANQIRTAPLWALRTRNRLMHDGLSFTKEEAIARHGGQASQVRSRFNALSAGEKRQF